MGRGEDGVLLVPKQLQRSGMTGTVAYYGGRLSPAQAYGASHPPSARPTSAQLLGALQFLFTSGVLTADELANLRTRVPA
jgi:hypothetical protein